jgi:hypothetical protein
MSNEKTILPNSVLVSLYKDTLVLPEFEKNKPEIISTTIVPTTPANVVTPEVIDTSALNDTQRETGPIKYLGEHLKQVTIIVKDELAVYLNENDLTLLSSILSACKLTLADIALINVAQQKLSLHEILNVLPSKLVMIFDVSSATLKIKLPTTLYKSIQLGDTYLLFSNSLSLMQGGDQSAKLEKGKLWAILKQLFQL